MGADDPPPSACDVGRGPQAWLKYVREHHETIGTLDEVAYRTHCKAFLENRKMITELNRPYSERNRPPPFGPTRFTHLTHEQFMAYVTGLPAPASGSQSRGSNNNIQQSTLGSDPQSQVDASDMSFVEFCDALAYVAEALPIGEDVAIDNESGISPAVVGELKDAADRLKNGLIGSSRTLRSLGTKAMMGSSRWLKRYMIGSTRILKGRLIGSTRYLRGTMIGSVRLAMGITDDVVESGLNYSLAGVCSAMFFGADPPDWVKNNDWKTSKRATAAVTAADRSANALPLPSNSLPGGWHAFSERAVGSKHFAEPIHRACTFAWAWDQDETMTLGDWCEYWHASYAPEPRNEDYIDWRKLGGVTKRVYDQGLSCGSCWATAPVYAAEGCMAAEARAAHPDCATSTEHESDDDFSAARRCRARRLSAQQLLDCTPGSSCAGGDPYVASAMAMGMGGFVREKDYPFAQQVDPSGKCAFARSSVAFDAIFAKTAKNAVDHGYDLGNRGLIEALHRAPVAVKIDPTLLSSYNGSGIISGEHCAIRGPLVHMTALVAYVHPGVFVLKNSWGSTDWGDAGYMYVSASHPSVKGCLGIASECLSPCGACTGVGPFE
jgi:hypothetical protein